MVNQSPRHSIQNREIMHRGYMKRLPYYLMPTNLNQVIFPLLLMQPGMGGGIAASRAPRPAFVRIQSLLTHAVFGLGLFATARLFNILYPN